MNMIPRQLGWLTALLLISVSLSAQNDWQVKQTALHNSPLEEKVVQQQVQPPQIISSIRYHKRLPKTHSGIVIELAASNLPLERDLPIFRQFGNVHYHKLNEGGYSYIITTNFTTNESAQRFLQNIIKPKAPEAKVIEYEEGKRNFL
ncbi:hypothetical protein OAF63_01300 [Saprospiraceae bacterium]|jgi:hypothetical protein|nr:hypothetical protein [Bacteroidota bacterium]MDB4727399.1 hypothetical protein [Saprospiraceae bacterium]MDF1866174.1 hypothetical protein [Saprospiraceae bacterium]